jgi:hypothetical protein
MGVTRNVAFQNQGRRRRIGVLSTSGHYYIVL